MKTVNINLIGSSLSSSKTLNRSIKDKEKIGESAKTLFKIMIISSSVLFVGSLGFWLYNISQIKELNFKIEKMKSESLVLDTQYKKLDSYGKTLVRERSDLEEEMKYKEKIEKKFLPWSKILSDLTHAIPQNVVIDEINKEERASATGDEKLNFLKIKGRINSSKSPLQSLTFFLLNLNENFIKNTTLENAKAGDIRFDEKDKVYSFDVQTEIKSQNLQKKKTKVSV